MCTNSGPFVHIKRAKNYDVSAKHWPLVEVKKPKTWWSTRLTKNRVSSKLYQNTNSAKSTRQTAKTTTFKKTSQLQSPLIRASSKITKLTCSLRSLSKTLRSRLRSLKPTNSNCYLIRSWQASSLSQMIGWCFLTGRWSRGTTLESFRGC